MAGTEDTEDYAALAKASAALKSALYARLGRDLARAASFIAPTPQKAATVTPLRPAEPLEDTPRPAGRFSGTDWLVESVASGVVLTLTDPENGTMMAEVMLDDGAGRELIDKLGEWLLRKNGVLR